jgi:hypothetical protein
MSDMRACWIDDTITRASTRLCGGQENIAVDNQRIRLAMIIQPLSTFVLKAVLDLAVY